LSAKTGKKVPDGKTSIAKKEEVKAGGAVKQTGKTGTTVTAKIDPKAV